MSHLYQKGQSGNPAGRPAGTGNKATTKVREVFAAFLEANLPRMQELFDRVAAQDAAKALDLLDRFAAYTTPKLKAIDHTSDGKTMPVVTINVPPMPDGGPQS